MLFLHAQKDMTTEVENDQKLNVDNDRTVTINKGNETVTLKQGNQTTGAEARRHLGQVSMSAPSPWRRCSRSR